MSMHSRVFLCLAVGLADFLEYNFHAINCKVAASLWHSGGKFLRVREWSLIVSADHTARKPASVLRNQWPGREFLG